MRFAAGKKAFGFSDRSGFRYPLNKMRREWNGLKVGPDEYEEKHPQLEPRRVKADAQALKDPRPEKRHIDAEIRVGFPTLERPVPDQLRLPIKVGEVEIQT